MALRLTVTATCTAAETSFSKRSLTWMSTAPFVLMSTDATGAVSARWSAGPAVTTMSPLNASATGALEALRRIVSTLG